MGVCWSVAKIKLLINSLLKAQFVFAEGDALLYARDDIRLLAAADSRRQTGSSKRSGFSIDNRDHITPFGTFNDQGQAAGEIGSISGSTLSVGGKTRLLAEKGNIAVSGSSLVSQDDLLLKAGGDIDIRAAEHRQSQSERQVSSGIGSAVISDTEHFSGWMKNRRENEGKETRQAASQIGSLKGGVRIDAGGAYRQTGSDVAAARDIDISAQSVDIRAADNHGRSRQSERDLKIGTFAKISSPLIDLVNAAEGAAKSKADDRTRALQGLAAGAQAYQLADGVGKVADAVKNQTGQQGAVLLSVEAGFGFKTASKEQNQNYRQSRESSLKAGGDINIRSREGDITVQGSNITAGDTIRLDSARDILLQSAQDSQHQDGKNRNAGVQVGVGVSVGAQTGVYIYAEAAYGKGKNRSDSQTHQNTLLQSDKLQLSSKGNTVLNGAQAHAKRIDAEVGGTLHIESPQDTVEQESKQSGGGIRAQVALGTAWSVSGNYNQSKANGHSRSVGSQSGLFAGEGGYHIKADSVRLKGGAIASAADKDHNELTARSFSFEDIRNESSYSAQSMGIGAGYGGSLKGSDGFNQSAFGRASQTAGQNMNKGLNYSPTLPQHESGDSQGYTRSVLSEGNITIGGKKTSARALGIQTDLQNAHRSAEAVPDLQNLLDKQQTVAQSTATIHSAVGTYRGNRAKAAAEELEKQQAAYEGRLKEQNDGSYEQYAGKSDSERLAMRLGNAKYAQAYQEARSWGVGGSKSRALSAAETLITGALGGQGDLQLAANTLAPYAAAAIGKRFGHGENKNEAAQAIGHFMLGAALAYANGADPLAGGSAAVAAERAAEYLAKQYDDGRTAIDPISGKFNPNLLPEHIKEEIKAQTGALASVVGAAGGSLNGTNGGNGALFDAQVAGTVGQNAVENNYLTSTTLDDVKKGKKSKEDALRIYRINKENLERQCATSQSSSLCRAAVNTAKDFVNNQLAKHFFPDEVKTTNQLLEKYSEAAQYKPARLKINLPMEKSMFTGEGLPEGRTSDYIKGTGKSILAYVWDERGGATGGAQYGMPIGTFAYNQYALENPYQTTKTRQEYLGSVYGPAVLTLTGAKFRIRPTRPITKPTQGKIIPTKDYRYDLNIGKNNPNFNKELHKTIYDQDPRRIEAVKARDQVNKANRERIKNSPHSLVLEKDVHGNEIFYRRMSYEDFMKLKTYGELPATSETFISPLKAYSEQGYNGVLVKFTTKPGTMDLLKKIGTTGNSATNRLFPDLPRTGKGWTEKTQVQFKLEGQGKPYVNKGKGVVNTGLGRAGGKETFEKQIIYFEKIGDVK